MNLVVHGLSLLLYPSVSSIVGFTHCHFLGDLTPSTSPFLSHISNFFFLYYTFFNIHGTQVPLHKNNEQNHHLLLSVSTSTHHRHGLTFWQWPLQVKVEEPLMFFFSWSLSSVASGAFFVLEILSMFDPWDITIFPLLCQASTSSLSSFCLLSVVFALGHLVSSLCTLVLGNLTHAEGPILISWGFSKGSCCSRCMPVTQSALSGFRLVYTCPLHVSTWRDIPWSCGPSNSEHPKAVFIQCRHPSEKLFYPHNRPHHPNQMLASF